MYARISLLGTLCAIMSANAPAAVLTVPSPAYPTIQAAINAAQPADEVHVQPGSYNEAIDLLGKAIVLKGTGGPGVTTIDATGIQASVITCTSGESSSTVIEGFTITRYRHAGSCVHVRREPDTVRAPDVAFVRRDRMHLVKERGFFPGAPDLAVEVLSPDDSASSVLDKVQDWLDGATAAVWVVDPKPKTIRVYEQAKPPRSFSEGDALTSDDLLQGLSIAVADIFK